jgi:hypothetical protein
MDNLSEPIGYEIRVRGVLSETLLTAFPGLESLAQEGDTLLIGDLPDRAALHGVLSQIEALGLELLEVRRTFVNLRACRRLPAADARPRSRDSSGTCDDKSSRRAGDST